MPKKSRKGRLKHQRRVNTQPIATKDISSPTQLLSHSNKQAPPAKSQVAIDDLATRHQHVRSDLKRTFIIGGAVFALLFILYFIFH
jgi:hypothetical protein